jgi:uncharacterized repeat protein (TIGR02543 family)
MVEYIEGNGTQYIETDYSAPEGFVGNAKILFTKLYGEESILGSHNLKSPYARNYIGTTNGGSVWEIGVGNTYVSSTAELSSGNIYDIEFSTLKTESYLIANNEKVISTHEENERSASGILLFTCHWVMHMGMPTANMRIYSMEIYNHENELGRNFIPSLNPEGIVGLYDLVEGKFYKNAGTGQFSYEEIMSSEELSKIVSLGKTYGHLPQPEREGFTFDGWYTKNEEKITSDTIVTDEAENQVLYAKWIKNVINEKN